MKTITIVAVFLLLCTLIHPSAVDAQKTYTSPSLFSQVPHTPDILAGGAGVLKKAEYDIIIQENTTPWDAYVSYGVTRKTHPLRLCRYWQISHIYEFKLRSHFNNAIITPQKTSIINFHYTHEHLKIMPFLYFPENSLKIVESDDNGESWIMLKNTAIDMNNNTITAITTLNKGYMVVAGFVNPKIMCNYNYDVKGASTLDTEVQHQSSGINKIQFFYTVILDMLRYKSESAML